MLNYFLELDHLVALNHFLKPSVPPVKQHWEFPSPGISAFINIIQYWNHRRKLRGLWGSLPGQLWCILSILQIFLKIHKISNDMKKLCPTKLTHSWNNDIVQNNKCKSTSVPITTLHTSSTNTVFVYSCRKELIPSIPSLGKYNFCLCLEVIE